VSGEGPIRVVIVDDEPLMRAGLAMLLDAQEGMVVVGQAGDGGEGVALARELRPEVVLMDIRMPGTDGVAATRELVGDSGGPGDSEGHGGPAVLVLTTFNEDAAVYAALRAGASGFLLKSAAPHDLVSAVRAVSAGDAWLHPAIARTLLSDFAARPTSPLPTSKDLRCLTRRESEVLGLVAHGLDNTAIAAHLVLSEATVRTHVGRILLKLGLHGRAQAVVAAYRSGLVNPADAVPSQPRSGRDRAT